MIKTIKKQLLLAASFAAVFGGLVGVFATTQTVSAECSSGFLTFPAWYDGIVDGDCNIQGPDQVGGVGPYIWIIVLNIIEIMFQAMAYLALFFVVYGGFTFITSSGSSDKTARAQKTILNAAIGLVIAIGAVGLKNIVWDAVVGSGGTGNGWGLPERSAAEIVQSVLSLIYFVSGIAAVITIIIGGFTYATSSGDSSKTARAKNTILYAVIGLVLVIVAYALTRFVIGVIEGGL